MGHLETEGTFWRSTYLFSCSYLEWLCNDHLSWCMSLTYFPSFRRISKFSSTALCVVRARGAAECQWLAPRTTWWEGSVCIYILSSHWGPWGAHHGGLHCVAAHQILRQCASLVDYIQVWFCVTGIGRIFSRQLACWAWSLIFEMVSLSPVQDPFLPLFRVTNCVLCSPY